jgi:hypothetical protein
LVFGHPADIVEQVDVVAIDAGGGVRWRQTIFSSGRDAQAMLALAPDGGVFVRAGSSNEPPVFGGQPSSTDATVAELDAATGSLRWTKPLVGNQALVDGAPPTYAGGDRLALGNIEGTVDLGGAAGVVAGPGMLVARLDGAGVGEWGRVLRSPPFGGLMRTAVAVDSRDRMYVATDFDTSLDLGDGTVLRPWPEAGDTSHDVVIAFDGSGTITWTALASFRDMDGIAATARGAILGQATTPPARSAARRSPRPTSTTACAPSSSAAPPRGRSRSPDRATRTATPLGAIGGRSFIAIESSGDVDASIDAHASFDGLDVDGNAAVLVEIGTE